MPDDGLMYGPDDPRAWTLVTLDGPAGVGKSTTARAVARELGYRYLDSGALYRAVTYALLQADRAAADWSGVSEAELDELGLQVRPGDHSLEVLWRGRILDEELRSDEVTSLVSQVASLPAVRGWLLNAQRSAASDGRLVADGRDMGSVVFPQARCKVYLEAEPRERARRRLGDHGVSSPTESQIRSEMSRLTRRDRQDQERAHSPLRVPRGALVVNTTQLGFEEQVRRIAEHARETVREAPPTDVDAPES